MTKRTEHVYGPVNSWRLGKSLGIDPVYTGEGLVCSFDCVYCQAGETEILTDKRRIFVSTRDILKEIKSFSKAKVDYVTFSGSTEPTLAKNLGEIIKGIRKIRNEKIAVITNSSLIGQASVQKDLRLADFVMAKLDAHSEGLFKKISKPAKTVKLKNIIKGLKDFKSKFKGRFALQVMFTSGNKKYAGKIASLVRSIAADEVYINTPRRRCGVKPLSKNEIRKIKVFFKGMNTTGVYDAV